MYPYNLSKYKQLRKLLRKNQTNAESKLWFCLRNRRFHGLKFYRQYSVDRYILDFYCPAIQLGIEVDGSQHRQHELMLYDKEREIHLSTLGIRILRYQNNDVLTNIDGVLEDIRLNICK